MEIIEIIAWLALGFVPTFGGLQIMNRKLRTSKPYGKMTRGDLSKGVIEGGL
jgi:hypothetical protein